MSRSQPSVTKTPAKTFFEFSPQAGELRYFDKSLGEKGENVTVPMPFRFLYLESVYQIGGGKKVGRGKEKEFIGFFSNAVKDLRKDTFTVKDKHGVVVEGLYEDIKKESGVKLIVGIYLAHYNEDKQLQIGYLKLKGSSMGEWWDFCKKYNVEQGSVTLTRGEEQEGEQGVYYLPAFLYSAKVSDETNAAAIELDKELQTYLSKHLGHENDPEPEEEKPTLQSVALAATAANDELKRIGTGFGAYGHAAGIPEPSDPFGEMSIPDTEPAFDEELEADAKKKDDDIPF